MKIAVHIQPSGDYLVIPKKYGSENNELWGRGPILVIDADTTDEDVERAIQTLFGGISTIVGSPSNVFAGILTAVFKEGVRFGKQPQPVAA